MSPLWGFRVFGVSRFYKHAAPLGLNAESNAVILIRTPDLDYTLHFSEAKAHMSPLWGFKTFVYRVFYMWSRWGSVSESEFL